MNRNTQVVKCLFTRTFSQTSCPIDTHLQPGHTDVFCYRPTHFSSSPTHYYIMIILILVFTNGQCTYDVFLWRGVNATRHSLCTVTLHIFFNKGFTAKLELIWVLLQSVPTFLFGLNEICTSSTDFIFINVTKYKISRKILPVGATMMHADRRAGSDGNNKRFLRYQKALKMS